MTQTLLISIIFTILGSVIPFHSPQSINWSDYYELTQLVDAPGGYPRITSDRNNNVYAAWLSWNEDKTSNSVYFTRLENNEWQEPIEIIYSDQYVLLGDIVVSDDAQINIVWSSGSELNLSYCDITNVSKFTCWKTIQLTLTSGIISYPSMPHLSISKDNSTWVISWATQNGVYIKTSNDGYFWGQDLLIWDVDNNQIAPSNGSVLIEGSSIHVTWSEHYGNNNWAGQAIWYARINGETVAIESTQKLFSTSPEIGPTVSWPSLALDNQNNLYVMWNNGVGSGNGRYLISSTDNGDTWSPYTNLFPGELSGQTGLPKIIIDNDNKMHVFSAALGPDGREGAIRYFIIDQGVWTDYETILSDGYSTDDEFPDAILTNDNIIHLVWGDIKGRIFYRALQISTKNQFVIGDLIRKPTVLKTDTDWDKQILPTLDITPTPFVLNEPYSSFKSDVPQLPIVIATLISIGFLTMVLFFKNRNNKW